MLLQSLFSFSNSMKLLLIPFFLLLNWHFQVGWLSISSVNVDVLRVMRPKVVFKGFGIGILTLTKSRPINVYWASLNALGRYFIHSASTAFRAFSSTSFGSIITAAAAAKSFVVRGLSNSFFSPMSDYLLFWGGNFFFFPSSSNPVGGIPLGGGSK